MYPVQHIETLNAPLSTGGYGTGCYGTGTYSTAVNWRIWNTNTNHYEDAQLIDEEALGHGTFLGALIGWPTGAALMYVPYVSNPSLKL